MMKSTVLFVGVMAVLSVLCPALNAEEAVKGEIVVLPETVGVLVLVKAGRVVFRVGELERAASAGMIRPGILAAARAYAIHEGQKRTIVQPNSVFDPEPMMEIDYSVMTKLLDELAKKTTDEELGLKPDDKVLPQGALIFEIEEDGNTNAKVLVDGTSVPVRSMWNVGQEMMTNDKQYVHLVLTDRTAMTVGPKSKVTLQQTKIEAGANLTTIHLREGSVRVSTSKIATQGDFKVSTPLGEAVAMGTDFHVSIQFGDLFPRVIPTSDVKAVAPVIPKVLSP